MDGAKPSDIQHTQGRMLAVLEHWIILARRNVMYSQYARKMPALKWLKLIKIYKMVRKSLKINAT